MAFIRSIHDDRVRHCTIMAIPVWKKSPGFWVGFAKTYWFFFGLRTNLVVFMTGLYGCPEPNQQIKLFLSNLFNGLALTNHFLSLSPVFFPFFVFCFLLLCFTFLSWFFFFFSFSIFKDCFHFSFAIYFLFSFLSIFLSPFTIVVTSSSIIVSPCQNRSKIPYKKK